MTNVTVLSVNMDCRKCKKLALQSITKICGIDEIKINMREKTITVVGDADPVCLVNKIRRKFKCAHLLNSGQPPSPPKPPETNTDKPKRPESKTTETNKPAETQPIKYICYPGPCTAHDPHRPPHCRGCSGCSNRPDIQWPRCHSPRAPSDEVWYVWNEETQNPCTIC